jgi:transposase InsO family protein
VAVTVDHYSRRLTGTAVYKQQPTSQEIRTFLGRAMKTAQEIPKHLITDQGKQFTDEGFKAWCERKGIKQRFGAIGKYGSIAVIERLMRTIKSECTRKLLVSYRHDDVRRELGHFTKWYNQYRPHAGLDGCTPDEIYFKKEPAGASPRYSHEGNGHEDHPALHRELGSQVDAGFDWSLRSDTWPGASIFRSLN